jgi:arsenate reductase
MRANRDLDCEIRIAVIRSGPVVQPERTRQLVPIAPTAGVVMTLSNIELILLHNPKCSKSRQTKALLEERGHEFIERCYLDDPLSREELEDLASRLGRPVRDWVRRKETVFGESGLDQESGDDAILDLMADHAILMERPILIRGARAVVGRPPEDVLALLD